MRNQQLLDYRIGGRWELSRDSNLTEANARDAVGLLILEHVIKHVAAEGCGMERLISETERRPDGWLVGSRPCLPGRCLTWRDAHWLLWLMFFLETEA